MKRLLLVALMLAWAVAKPCGAEKRSAFDLAGKWIGPVEFGKFKFKLVLRIAKTPEGRLVTTIDVPEQGQKDAPVSALLFNDPEVRLEMDQFGTAYNGKLSGDKNEINGEFEEGPGGRPLALTFKRSNEPDAPEPKKVFTFAAGEAKDIRGYWKGSMEPFPGMNVTAALNIGRMDDGTFRATLDLLDQGAKDIPASSVSGGNKSAKLEWQGFQAVFDGKLDETGNTLAGNWLQRGRTNPVTFTRLEEPASLLPKNLSFEPEKGEDIRGFWMGTLESPNGKLRLAFKIGRAPDGAFGGSMVSLDQGRREIPMSSAKFEKPKVLLEWKGIRGKFDGTINKEGTAMEGKWEQFGNPMPLKLERTPSFEGEKKS